MSPEHRELLARVEHYEFTAEFVRRLMRENCWSRAFAGRVCREYKRFSFLALVAGHPCTPSDQVDQVWHLHLLDTRGYWQRFCTEVLRAPLHHGPSRGGAREAAKFRLWYERTRASYRVWFGCEAPSDIWPAPAARFAGRFRRVDQHRVWLVRKPGFSQRPSAAHDALTAAMLPLQRSGALGLAMVIAGCSSIGLIPPLNLKGPDFLRLFLLGWCACVLGALWLRRRARAALPAAAPELDAYALAYLGNGEAGLTQALLARLIDGRHLEIREARRICAGRRVLVGGHDLERGLWEHCREAAEHGASYQELHQLVAARSRAVRARLERAGLLLSRRQQQRWFAVALLAPALGVVKIGVGLALGKPILLLALCVLLTWPLSSAALRPGLGRTHAGDGLLARARETFQSSRASLLETARGEEPALERTVALFGLGGIPALFELHSLVSSPAQEREGGGGECGGGGGGHGCGGCGGCGG